MTTATVCQISAPTTSFERSLLSLSSRLARFAAARAERRAEASRRRSSSRQGAPDIDTRREATALAHAGILPR